MKKTILLFLAVLGISCSDSGPAPAPLNMAGPKLATSVTYSDGWTRTLDLKYDSNRRLVRIVEHAESSDSPIVFNLSYDEGDRLVLIDEVAGFHQTVAFTYDDSGRVSSWIHNGAEPKPVSYDQGVYAVPVGGIETSYAYDDMNDVTMTSNGNPVSYHYDGTKNGAFRNVVGNYQLFLFLDHILTRVGTKKALVSLSTWSTAHSATFTNTYDEQGYITGLTGLWGNGRQCWATITYNM